MDDRSSRGAKPDTHVTRNVFVKSELVYAVLEYVFMVGAATYVRSMIE
jgi:hypothetical protein